MKFKNEQQKRGESLIQEGFFDDDIGGGVFMGKARPFVLQNGLNNLYPDIRNEALHIFGKTTSRGGVAIIPPVMCSHRKSPALTTCLRSGIKGRLF